MGSDEFHKSCNSQKCSITLVCALTQFSNKKAPKYVAKLERSLLLLRATALGAEGSLIWADGLVRALFTQVSFPESRSLSAWS